MADIIPYISNTNTIKFYVRDQIADSDLSTATVTFSLDDTTGSNITSGTMSYDSMERKKNKNYHYFKGTISHSASLSENTLYYLTITLTSGSTQGYWQNLRVIPKLRELRN